MNGGCRDGEAQNIRIMHKHGQSIWQLTGHGGSPDRRRVQVKKLANRRNDFVSRWHLNLRTSLSLVFDLGYLGDLIIPWLFLGNGPGLQRKHTLPTGTDLLQDNWVDTRVFLDSQTQVSTPPTLHPWKTCNKATQSTMPAKGEYPSQMNASSTQNTIVARECLVLSWPFSLSSLLGSTKRRRKNH